MKKYVKSSTDPNNYVISSTFDYSEDINIQSFDLDSIMKDKVQRRIYGKMLNLVDDAVEPWLQGVLDLAEVSGMNIPGIVNIWNAIQEHGVEAVKEVLNRK